MIVEHRMYTLHPGKTNEYLTLYEEEGRAIQEPILGHLVGYFSTEIGPLNTIVHMWAYENFEEREKRRDQLKSDERWKEFVTRLRPLIREQQNMILRPASFSPPR